MKKHSFFKKVISLTMAIAMMASIGSTVMAEDTGVYLSQEQELKLLNIFNEANPTFAIDAARAHNNQCHNGALIDDKFEIINEVVSVSDADSQNVPPPQSNRIDLRYVPCPGPNGHEYKVYILGNHNICTVDNCGQCDYYETYLYECKHCGDAYSGQTEFKYSHYH